MRRLDGDQFDRQWVLLCEGAGDKRFFEHLLTTRGIPSNFNVRHPGDEVDSSGTGGRSKFGKWLATRQQTSETFRSTVKAVLIVSDNDDNPDQSFQEVQDQLAQTTGFPVPPNQRVAAQAQGYPAIVTLMIPIGRPGNLETLCVEAAYSKWPLKAPLDAYVAATPAGKWSLKKSSKTRMQSLLAATCEPKPDVSFAQHWLQREEFRVPVDHEIFNEIGEFLRDFGRLLP